MKTLTPWFTMFLLIMIWTGCQQNKPEKQDQIEESPQTDEDLYFEDYLPVRNKWGFLNKKGETVIKPQYDQVDYFSEGICAVNFQGKWGYINLSGKMIIEPQFKGAWLFKEGRAKIWEFGGKYGYINIKGEKIGDPEWDESFNFQNHRAKVRRKAYFGYINHQGNLVIPLAFEIGSDFRNHVAKVRQNGKYGLIDTLGNWVIPAEYEVISDYHNDLIKVRRNKKYGYINPQNQLIIDYQYDACLPFQHGVSFAQKNNQWQRLDQQGHEYRVTPFDDIRYAGEERWIYRVKRMFGLMNKHGEPITDPVFQQLNNFSEKKACFMQDDLWGYTDQNGISVIPPKYGLCWDFCNNVARVADLRGILFIDSEGTEIIQGEYNEVKDFKQNLAPFQER